MKNIYYIFLPIILLVSGCAEHQPLYPSPQGKPIELTAATDSKNGTKAVISGLNDLLGDGFVVWASWTKDPEDSDIFTNDYSSGHTDLVFNRYGTKVYATDGNSSSTFDPGSETQDTWYYTPPRYWHRGTYTFAAALPASIFNASHAKTPEENIGNLATGVFSNNVLTLDFGKDAGNNVLGLDLSSEQVDLMVTFSDVDNRDEAATYASLHFQQHQFSQVVIEAGSNDENADLIVDEVTFWGNHKTTAGPMTITFGDDAVTSEYEVASLSTSSSPYQVISDIGVQLPNAVMDAAGNWVYTYNPIVPGLIVFPEECTMSIKVKYRVYMDDPAVASQQYEATVSTPIPVTWEANKKYVYKLLISNHRVDIVSSGIMDWNQVDINHDFS